MSFDHLKTAWCDCSLLGQSWINAGRDLEFDLRMGDGSTLKVVFTWTAGYVSQFAYADNRGGPPLSWDVTFQKRDARWHVLWDFASMGFIEFTFQDAVLPTSTDERSNV